MPTKFSAKGLSVQALDPAQVEDRRADFERDWAHRLSHLVQDPEAVTFATVWQTVMHVVHEAAAHYSQPG